MEQYLELIIQYLPYVAIPLIVAGLIQSLKKAFKGFFSKPVGMRIMPFIPVVLGAILGLALPLSAVLTKLLAGAALGTVSTTIYKVLTVTLATKLKLDDKITRKTMDLPEEGVSDEN